MQVSFFTYFQFTVLGRAGISFPLAPVLDSHVFPGLIISIFIWCSLGQRWACRGVCSKEKQDIHRQQSQAVRTTTEIGVCKRSSKKDKSRYFKNKGTWKRKEPLTPQSGQDPQVTRMAYTDRIHLLSHLLPTDNMRLPKDIQRTV
jgi:hypothetical protein